MKFPDKDIFLVYSALAISVILAAYSTAAIANTGTETVKGKFSSTALKDNSTPERKAPLDHSENKTLKTGLNTGTLEKGLYSGNKTLNTS